MDRKQFLKSSALISGMAIAGTDSLFAASLADTGIDKLVDEKGNFIQPPLPFSESALEPFMDEETVHLHYTFHHGGAVKAANKDMQMIKEALDTNDLTYADYWTKKSAHHVSSHILHSIFWTNLSSKKNEPKGNLLKRIEKDFGSFERLKTIISIISKSVDGNGWGILAYQPLTDKLIVMQCENHEKLTQWGCIPLLVIDVWEHAYYLKHKNKRDQFVDTLVNIINWDNAAERLNAAVKFK